MVATHRKNEEDSPRADILINHKFPRSLSLSLSSSFLVYLDPNVECNVAKGSAAGMWKNMYLQAG